MGKWIGSSVVLLIAVVFGWHYYLTGEARGMAQQSNTKAVEQGGETRLVLNPVTDVVNMTIALPVPETDEKNPIAGVGSQLGDALANGLVKVAEPLIERELNTKARERFDLYAMLVPYRLRISVEQPDPQTVARVRGRRAELLKAEEQRKRDKAASYVQQGLALEGLKVAAGERFGRKESGVFGTIVNRGDQTLRKVKVRIYFLDADGKRIGETDYSPVLMSEFALGENAPLRPGYRKDFGYSVEQHAPSGWAKKVEAEIVEIEFSE